MRRTLALALMIGSLMLTAGTADADTTKPPPLTTHSEVWKAPFTPRSEVWKAPAESAGPDTTQTSCAPFAYAPYKSGTTIRALGGGACDGVPLFLTASVQIQRLISGSTWGNEGSPVSFSGSASYWSGVDTTACTSSVVDGNRRTKVTTTHQTAWGTYTKTAYSSGPWFVC
jgi:hypothetical protein